MPTKIGINGFGRIGRLVMRAALDNPDGTSLFCSFALSRIDSTRGEFVVIDDRYCVRFTVGLRRRFAAFGFISAGLQSLTELHPVQGSS
jgi:hypothetical protein